MAGTVRIPSRLALAAAAVVTLGLSACGGDEPSDTASTATSSPAETTAETSPSAAAEGQGSSLAVTSVDFDFELDSEDLQAGSYEITLTNDGGSTHDLVVERDGEDVAASDAIDPGQTSTFTVDLEPGEYVFYCSIGNHRSMGMEVTVEVS